MIATLCYYGGVLLPLYGTYTSIKTENQTEQYRWLVFWMVFLPVIILEYIPGLVAFIPGFYQCKLLFIIYLTHPKFKGAEYLFSTFVAPFLDQREVEIDASLARVRHRASVKVTEVATTGLVYAQQHGISWLQLLGSQLNRIGQQHQQQHPAITEEAMQIEEVTDEPQEEVDEQQERQEQQEEEEEEEDTFNDPHISPVATPDHNITTRRRKSKHNRKHHQQPRNENDPKAVNQYQQHNTRTLYTKRTLRSMTTRSRSQQDVDYY